MTNEHAQRMRRAATALCVTLMSTPACDVAPRAEDLDVARGTSTTGLTTASYQESHLAFSPGYFDRVEIASDAAHVVMCQTTAFPLSDGLHVSFFEHSSVGLTQIPNPFAPWPYYLFTPANNSSFYGSARDTVAIDDMSLFMGDPNAPGNTNSSSLVRVMEITDEGALVEIDEWAHGLEGVSGYGARLKVAGDVLIVSAPLEPGSVTGVGAVYVYRRGESGFALSERIASPQPSQYGSFGYNIDLESRALLATSMDHPTSPFVHVYDVGDTNVSFIESIPLSHPEEDDYFIAADLDMSGDHALVAVQSSSDIHPSYVVALERADDHWSEVQVLTAEIPYPPNLQPFPQLVDVELSGDLAVIAWQDAAGTRVDLYQWTTPCEGCGAWVYASTVEGWTEDPSARTALDLHGSRLIVANSVTGMANVFDLDDRLGAPCSSISECAVGFCRDGVCCQDDCAGGDPSDCVACSVAAGGHIDGRCAALDGVPCDDGNACTGIDTCVEGACVTSPLGPSTLCDDGDGCTALDVCQSGACVGGGNACDDENPCTIDTCTNNACEHVNVDDETPCAGGACFDGKCIPSTQPTDAGASPDARAAPTDAGPVTPPTCTCDSSSSSPTDLSALVIAALLTRLRRRSPRHVSASPSTSA